MPDNEVQFDLASLGLDGFSVAMLIGFFFYSFPFGLLFHPGMRVKLTNCFV